MNLRLSSIAKSLVVCALITLLACCKTRPSSHPCFDENALSSAQLPSSHSYYHGGFIEIAHADNTTVRCDALIMPHVAAGGGAEALLGFLKITEWQGLSISVSRMCLTPLAGSKLFLLLDTGALLGDLGGQQGTHTMTATTNEGAQQDHHYLRIPLSSDYFDRLGTVRTKFISLAGADGKGAQRLTAFERLRSQIYRTRIVDYKALHGASWSEELDGLLKNIQYNACSFGELAGQLTISGYSQRYEKMMQYRTQDGKNLACFVFSDLMQFSAQVDLSDLTEQERTDFTSHQPTFNAQHIIKHSAQDPNIIKDGTLRTSLETWGTNLTSQSHLHLQSLEARVDLLSAQPNIASSTELLPQEITQPTLQDKTALVNQQAYWGFIETYGQKRAPGLMKQVGSNFNPLIAAHRLMNRNLLPLEQHAVIQIPHKALSVAGNVRTDLNDRVRFSNQNLPQDKTELYHAFYGLMAGYNDHKDGHSPHPIHQMQSGSFVLLGGQPIALLLVVNKALRERSGTIALKDITSIAPEEEPAAEGAADPAATTQVAGAITIDDVQGPTLTTADPDKINAVATNEETLTTPDPGVQAGETTSEINPNTPAGGGSTTEAGTTEETPDQTPAAETPAAETPAAETPAGYFGIGVCTSPPCNTTTPDTGDGTGQRIDLDCSDKPST